MRSKQTIKCKICGGNTRSYITHLFDDRYGAPGKYDIYRCSTCGFGSTKPELKSEWIGKFYARYYPLLSYTPTTVTKSVNIPSQFRAWFNGTDNTAHWHIKPQTKVLDIGSASGVSLLEIKRLGAEAYGVEPDPNAQGIAKKLKLKVYKGFITDNPFPEIKFDYITASQVIEHDPDPKSFLLAAKSKLKENGLIILSFPNFDALYRKIFGKRWLHYHVPYHINFFTSESLTKLAAFTGLKIVKKRTITPNLWTLMQLRMLIVNTQEGTPNPLWNEKFQKQLLNKSNTQQALLSRLIPFASFPLAVLNRLLDIFCQGESFLIFLEYDKNAEE